jgi:hypothetical protein
MHTIAANVGQRFVYAFVAGNSVIMTTCRITDMKKLAILIMDVAIDSLPKVNF